MTRFGATSTPASGAAASIGRATREAHGAGDTAVATAAGARIGPTVPSPTAIVTMTGGGFA